MHCCRTTARSGTVNVNCNKVDNLCKKKSNQELGKAQKAIECFNPTDLQTPAMLSHSEMSKYIAEIPRNE